MLSQMKQNIMDAIDGNIEAFIAKLAKVYDLPVEDLRVIWDGGEVEVEAKEAVNKKVSQVVPKVIEKVSVIVPVGRTCQHMWTKGDRKGTLCSCEVKNPLKSYCVKHVKLNTDKPITPPVQMRIIPDMNNIKNKSKILRRNKTIDKLWHEDTGMVFESIEDRRVVSRLVNGELIDLTEDDVCTCKSLGFVIKEKPKEKPADNIPVIDKPLDIVEKVPIIYKPVDIVKNTSHIDINEKPMDIIVKKVPIIYKPVDIVKNTSRIDIKEKEKPMDIIVKKVHEYDRIKEVEDLLGQMQVSSYEEEELLEEEE